MRHGDNASTRGETHTSGTQACKVVALLREPVSTRYPCNLHRNTLYSFFVELGVRTPEWVGDGVSHVDFIDLLTPQCLSHGLRTCAGGRDSVFSSPKLSCPPWPCCCPLLQHSKLFWSFRELVRTFLGGRNIPVLSVWCFGFHRIHDALKC